VNRKVKLRAFLPFLTFAICNLQFAFSFANPPPLPTFSPLVFHPPKPERWVLPNGLVVFLLEDHELPLVKLEMLVRAGSQYDPPDKVGLQSLFGEVLAVGGSLHHTPEEIQRALDVTGGSLGFSVSLEDASGSLSCRAADFDKLFPLWVDLLRNPQFQNHYLDIEKNKTIESLRRINDEPEEITRREFRRLIYGTAHPYARIPDPASIKRIARKDLLDVHAQYVHPNAMMIAVSGDFDRSAMKIKLQTALGDWPRADVAYPNVPAVIPTTESKLYYIERPINQSQIRMGHTGLKRHSPDHFAWEVFNELWGGGSTSRLFSIVRTQKGLAYEVGSTFWEPKDLGLILSICLTRGPQTTAAIRSIMDITQGLQSAPFNEKEISFAKDSIRNRFVENYTSSAKIASDAMAMEFRGYPSDYLDTYPERIGKVTAEDLSRVAGLYLQPDKMITLVVGDLSTFDKPLSTIGRPQEVKPLDYSQEEP